MNKKQLVSRCLKVCEKKLINDKQNFFLSFRFQFEDWILSNAL